MDASNSVAAPAPAPAPAAAVATVLPLPQQQPQQQQGGPNHPAHPSTHPRTLYVGNLNPEVSDELMHALFSPLGHIKSCKIHHSQADPALPSYCFVEYVTHECAAAALVAMNKRSVLGKEMKVNWANANNQNSNGYHSSHHHTNGHHHPGGGHQNNSHHVAKPHFQVHKGTKGMELCQCGGTGYREKKGGQISLDLAKIG